MATTTTPVSSPPSRFGIVRALAYFLIFILLVALATLGWFYSVARSALPQLDGSLKVAGISAPVKVIRDGQGMPTIEAGSLEDLFFAQGFVTAQDRLWQMDIMRRFAAGEISEILGAEFLPHDREQRILGIRVAARKALEVSSAQDRSHFEAYARGVNAYIESHRDRLPIEFRILRYAPQPWAPEDSHLIAAQMVKDLNHYPYRDALEREKILAKLGPELTADLFVNKSWHDRPPTVMRPGLDRKPDQDIDDEDPPRGTVGGAVAGRTGWNYSTFLAAIFWPAHRIRIRMRALCLVRTTGWFPERTRFRASRCSRTICTSGIRCRTSGTKPISAAATSTLPESPCPACRM